MSEFQRRLAEKMEFKRMTIEVKRYDSMKEEIKELKESLLEEVNKVIAQDKQIKEMKDYTRHDQDCPAWYSKECNCGLSDLLK